LDVTTRARAVASALNVKDADGLARIKPDQLRDKYHYFDQDLWREFTRVLEALGYDVAKREHPWY
jgi:hypothetical protein